MPCRATAARRRDYLFYWDTVKYLKPRQILARLWMRCKPRPDVRRRPTPTLRTRARPGHEPVRRPASIVGPLSFVFLNRRETLRLPEDWNRPDLPKLWLYNLHYFDDLQAADASRRHQWHVALVDRWIADNPTGSGNGWEPYPTSLRIVNWIKWCFGRSEWDPATITSLARQTRWLAAHVEWHLMANHLIANAKALIFAGLFFEGAEADGWLKSGLSLFERQLSEQVLGDGGHFERSPMYHALILEDMLDLINFSAAYDERLSAAHVPRWRAVAGGMLGWLRTMLHPDGEISFFNDAAFGIAPAFVELVEYAGRLQVPAIRTAADPVELLAESGFVRIARGPAVALLDVGPVGPDYQPGHAHADTLSFELSLFGRRLLVNGGTSTYEVSDERACQRATAAHNTVVVDGQDSSEMWSAFRVARRARPFGLSAGTDDGGTISVECAHDGYRRLAGAVVHRRHWRFSSRELEIVDSLTGQYRHARASFLLHPDVEVLACDHDLARLKLAGRPVDVRTSGGTMRAVPASWHPEFGRSLRTMRLQVDFERDDLRTQFDFGNA